MKILSAVLFFCLLFSVCARAKTEFSASVNASYIVSDNDTQALGSRSSNVFTVRPSLSAFHTTRKSRSNINIRHSYIEQFSSGNEEELGNDRSSFTNFDVSTRLSIVENVLQLNGRAAQSYRNTNAANSLVNDEFFGNRELAKTETYLVGFDLTLNRFDFAEFIADGKVSNVKSDRQTSFSTGVDNGLNNTNTDLTATIRAGKVFKYVDWNLTGRYSETSGSSNRDSVNESYFGNFYIGILKRLRLVATGTLEKNEFTPIGGTDVDLEGNRNVEYKTAGLGLSWFRDRSRFLDVTYNISSRTGNNDQREEFVATNFGWRFSSRTTVTGNFGRRFFGRSANFSLNHNIRKFRTRISYNEQVTNFSRLIASNQTVGGIVCPIGSTDFTECFIPDTLDFQLQPGQEFTSLSFIVPEISEQTILRKNLLFNTNYRFRKLNLTFTANLADTEYLDGSRNEQRENYTIAANMSLSRKLAVSWNNRLTNFENLSLTDEVTNKDDIWTSTISANYQNNRNLSTSLSYRYSERKSSVFERNYDGNRISLSVNYRF